MDARDEVALCSRVAELEALLIEEQRYRHEWARRALRAEAALEALCGPHKRKSKAPPVKGARQLDLED